MEWASDVGWTASLVSSCAAAWSLMQECEQVDAPVGREVQVGGSWTTGDTGLR